MYVLGLSFFYHNSAACLLKDGKILAAAEEERFSRKKNDPAFPENAIEFCLKHAGISIEEIGSVVFYEKPFLKLERTVISHIRNWPRALFGFQKILESILSKTARIPQTIRKKTGYEGDILFVRHHESHAASSFYTSPFREAAIVTVDGVGENETTTVGVGNADGIRNVESLEFPDSL